VGDHAVFGAQSLDLLPQIDLPAAEVLELVVVDPLDRVAKHPIDEPLDRSRVGVGFDEDADRPWLVVGHD
jgi:hypothetical protein